MKPKIPITSCVARAQSGYAGELIDRISPEIHQYIRARVPPHDVDDIMQEVMTKILTDINGLQDHNAFTGWCWKIVANKVRDHWRNKQRRGMDSLPDSTESIKACQDRVTPEQIISDREQSARLHRAMARLPEEEAYAIFLYYWEGQTMDVISREMNRPVGTIKRWLRNARGHLKEWLSEDE